MGLTLIYRYKLIVETLFTNPQNNLEGLNIETELDASGPSSIMCPSTQQYRSTIVKLYGENKQQ